MPFLVPLGTALASAAATALPAVGSALVAAAPTIATTAATTAAATLTQRALTKGQAGARTVANLAAGAAPVVGAYLDSRERKNLQRQAMSDYQRQNEIARTMTGPETRWFEAGMRGVNQQFELLRQASARQENYFQSIKPVLELEQNIWLAQVQEQFPELNIQAASQATGGFMPSFSQVNEATRASLPPQARPDVQRFRAPEALGAPAEAPMAPAPAPQPAPSPTGLAPPPVAQPPQVAPAAPPAQMAQPAPAQAQAPVAPMAGPTRASIEDATRDELRNTIGSSLNNAGPQGQILRRQLMNNAPLENINRTIRGLTATHQDPANLQTFAALKNITDRGIAQGGYAQTLAAQRGLTELPPEAQPTAPPAELPPQPSPLAMAPSPAERRRRQDERLGLTRDPDESPAEFRQRRREALEEEAYSDEVDRAAAERAAIGQQPPPPPPPPEEREIGIGDFMRRQRDGTLTQEDIAARQADFEAGRRPPPMGQPGAPLGGRPPQRIGAQQAPTAAAPEGSSAEALKSATDFITSGLRQLEGGFQLTSQQNQQIETAIDSARARARTDLERVRADGLRVLFDEVAPSLGLRPGDTPNLQRATRLLRDTGRDYENLNAQLAAQEAQLKLDIPLSYGQAAGQVRAPQASILGDIEERTRQARMGLLGGLSTMGQNIRGMGLDLARSVTPPSPSFPGGGISWMPTMSDGTMDYSQAGEGIASSIGDFAGRIGTPSPVTLQTGQPPQTGQFQGLRNPPPPGTITMNPRFASLNPVVPIDVGVPKNLNIPINLQSPPSYSRPPNVFSPAGGGRTARTMGWRD